LENAPNLRDLIRLMGVMVDLYCASYTTPPEAVTLDIDDTVDARGQAENLIKLHKAQRASDRTSCRSPLANQMRLILHTTAYWLMLTIRDTIPKGHALATAEFTTIRVRLLKLGARVVEMASRVRLAFAAACPDATFDPPHRRCADADRAVNDGAALRPGNPSRKPPAPTKDQSPRRNRRLGRSCPSRASVAVRLPPGNAANKSG
jgi:hypothetical protein